MKTAVIFYSHYGNTAYVANQLCDALSRTGESVLFEIECEDYKQTLLKRLYNHFFPLRVELVDIPLDLAKYDVVIFGIPVWAGRPSAPINKYITLCKGVEHKKIICVYIYAIEASAKKCSQFVASLLNAKDHPFIREFFLPWSNLNDERFLAKSIKDIIEEVEHK